MVAVSDLCVIHHQQMRETRYMWGCTQGMLGQTAPSENFAGTGLTHIHDLGQSWGLFET